MAQTQSFLEEHFPPVLASIIRGYITPVPSSTGWMIGYGGYGEYCLEIDDWMVLQGAIAGEHNDLVKSILENKDEFYLTDWLWSACEYGSTTIAELLLKHNADPNAGMYPASANGHVDIIGLLRQYGANNWNDGLQAACHTRRGNVIGLMIKYGANRCDCNGDGYCQLYWSDDD